ncbi:MAG: hypothetical protein SGARI_001858 [Bacillariaceae sp.]
MPCIIVTGHPSSGKTTAARLLRDRALLKRDAIDEVILLNEESECGCHDNSDNKATTTNNNNNTKQSCYETALAEKETRGTLKSAFDRAVGATTLSQEQRKRRLIILDSLNYIKGFRYELHCISKAAGETHGVLWVLNKPDIVKEWNDSKRPGNGGYSPELLQELILRYEPPDERNRWDRPLFTVDMAMALSQNGSKEELIMKGESNGTDSSTAAATTTKSEVLQQSVYNMHGLGDVLLGNNHSGSNGNGNDETLASSTDVDDPRQTGGTQQQQQQPLPASKPTKSAFQRAAPKKSAFQPTKPKSAKEQYAFTPDDLKALEETTAETEQSTTIKGEMAAASAATSSSSKPTIQNGTTASSENTAPVPTTIEEQLDQILDVFLTQTKALKEGISTRRQP